MKRREMARLEPGPEGGPRGFTGLDGANPKGLMPQFSKGLGVLASRRRCCTHARSEYVEHMSI